MYVYTQSTAQGEGDLGPLEPQRCLPPRRVGDLQQHHRLLRVLWGGIQGFRGVGLRLLRVLWGGIQGSGGLLRVLCGGGVDSGVLGVKV